MEVLGEFRRPILYLPPVLAQQIRRFSHWDSLGTGFGVVSLLLVL